MATQVFFRTTATTPDRASTGTNNTRLDGVASGWDQRTLLTVRGSAATSFATTSTVTGPTNGVEVNAGVPNHWISRPLDQAVTISGTITFNLWAAESSNSANVAINAVIERMDSTGTVASQVVKTARTTEVALTTRTVNNFTATPTSTAFSKGDRIRIRVFGDDAGTMATGFTFTFSGNGPTGGADGDSYVSFTETFGFMETDPTPAGLITQGTSVAGPQSISGGSAGSGTNEEIAQGFTLASSATVTDVDVWMERVGTVSDNVIVDIVSTLDGTSLGTSSVAGSSISLTAAYVRFTLASSASLASGSYFLQFSRSGARDTTNRCRWYYSTSNPYAGGSMWLRSSGSWSEFTANDFQFIINPSNTVYLTDTASSVSTAAVDREAWTSRGAGVQTDVTNTVTGWTTPIQITDTAGGTVVDWWTRPLTAFTLAGPVLVNVRSTESTSAANVSPRCEVAVTAGDGTAATVWGAMTYPSEISGVETAVQFYVAGADVSVANGQRIRIRIYIDDSGTAAMGAALTSTLFYAGTTPAASGDTYLTFGQALSEYSASTPSLAVPRLRAHMAAFDFDPWSATGWQ